MLEKKNSVSYHVLKAHDYRSFLGLVCLMQVSTREQDFLVDTLGLRDHMHLLNSSFANPSIVKVFHGADSDNQWLQRDFGVYLVNMFDTYHASHVLQMSHHSLAFLLRHYVNITLDKKYQLADWRIRPLPEEMARYAREDTHYLLYVFDRMRNELLAHRMLISDSTEPTARYSDDPHGSLKEVLRRSSQTLAKTFEKPIFTEDSYHMVACKKFPKHTFTQAELIFFRHLFRWRDQTARLQDESWHYVMPNYLLFRIMAKAAAEKSASLHSVTSCCDGIGAQASYTREHASDVVAVLKEAVEELEDAVDTSQVQMVVEQQTTHVSTKTAASIFIEEVVEHGEDTGSETKHIRFSSDSDGNSEEDRTIKEEAMVYSAVMVDVPAPKIKKTSTLLDSDSDSGEDMVEEDDDVKLAAPPTASPMLKRKSSLLDDDESDDEETVAVATAKVHPETSRVVRGRSKMMADSDEEENDDDNGDDDADDVAEMAAHDLAARIHREMEHHSILAATTERVSAEEESMMPTEAANADDDSMIESAHVYLDSQAEVAMVMEKEEKEAQGPETVMILSEKKRRSKRKGKQPEATSTAGVGGDASGDTPIDITTTNKKRKKAAKANAEDDEPNPAPAAVVQPLSLDELKDLSKKSSIGRMGDGSVSGKLARQGSSKSAAFDPYSKIEVDKKVCLFLLVGPVGGSHVVRS